MTKRLIDYTIQEAFDAACTHLAKQGRKSEDKHGRCEYRNEDGGRCAIGALLCDDEYDCKYEGFRAGAVFASLYGMEEGFFCFQLDSLQSCHDEAAVDDDGYFVRVWDDDDGVAKRLADFATSNKLNDSVLYKSFGEKK